MFLHHHKEPCGRYATKPEDKSAKDEVELYEEAEPIQQKIENIRTKIALQERYNAALKDNMEEKSTGNFAVLRSMFAEVFNLRVALKEAISKEKWAVNNALRTHRLFQLALRQCAPREALEWMDDKIFDNAKILNEHLDILIQKRKKLENMEHAVSILEKWPIPGTLPWEVKIEQKMKDVTVAQSNIQMKLECAKMLNVKYKTIRGRLQHDRTLYQPILRNLNSQLTFQLNELRDLEQMLGYAQKFQKDAERTLEWTEKDASTARKLRRAQISRMRREMQRIVQQEQYALQQEGKNNLRGETKQLGDGFIHAENSSLLIDNEETQLNDRLAQKRAIIETFNDNAAMLVDVMKIPNLTHIPTRMDNVINLTKILNQEKESKEVLRRNLIKQRDQLMQLFCVIRYTGNGNVTQNELVIQDYQQTLKGLEDEFTLLQKMINQDCQLSMDCQLGISSLIERIEGLDRKPFHIRSTDQLISVLPIFYDRLEGLVDSLKRLRAEIPPYLLDSVPLSARRQTQHRLAALYQQIPAKHIRVGESLTTDDISEEEEFEDFKVPGRLEIKMRSAKIVEQGLLRLGIITAGGAGNKRISTPVQKSLGASRYSNNSSGSVAQP